MTPSFERAFHPLALAGLLLAGCGGDITAGGGGEPTSAGTTPSAPLADPMQDERFTFGGGAQDSPFGAPDAAAPDAGAADRLGADGDTVGAAGDPSVLPGAAVGTPPALPQQAAGDASALPGGGAGNASALPAMDAGVPSALPGAGAGDPSALPGIDASADTDAAAVTFTDDAFTGFWAPVEVVPAAPREVLRVAAVPGAGFEVIAFLDRAATSGDAPGNCFEAAGGGVHDVVDGALRSVPELNAVRDYQEYAVEDGFLVLTRYVAPASPGTVSAVYARTLPGLAAQDLPVCDATAG